MLDTTPQLRILSIDGGGIKGIIPCVILQAIEDFTGRQIHELFDLIAGTSTGGIISIGVTTPRPEEPDLAALSPAELLWMYQTKGDAIFGEREKKSALLSLIGRFSPELDELTNKPYGESGLEKLLTESIGTAHLRDSLTEVLVPSFDLAHGEAFYFSSRLARATPEFEDFAVRDVARATSAAPTYFRPKRLRTDQTGELVLVDGGVFANNPSVLAYAEAKQLFATRGGRQLSSTQLPGQATVAPSDTDVPFLLLSLGTGFRKRKVAANNFSATKDWLKPMLETVFLESASENTHYLAKQLLPDYTDGTPRYYRFNPELPEGATAMDDVSSSNTTRLQEIAEAFIAEDENKRLLEAVCARL